MVGIALVRCVVEKEEGSSQDEGYFFDRITENNSLYDQLGLSKDTIQIISKIINNEKTGQRQKLGEIITDPTVITTLVPDLEDIPELLRSTENQELFVYRGEPKSLLFRMGRRVTAVIISKILLEAEKMISTLDSDFKQMGNVTKDFGLRFSKLMTAKEYASRILDLYEGVTKNYKFGPPRNEFEAQVIKDVAEITNSMLTNIEISFTKPNESFEYDILIPLLNDNILDIEITDYQSAREEIHETYDTLKSKLILSAIDKAQRLRAQVVIVAKGFPPSVFEQMKEFAISRKVALLNEEDYKKGIEEKIINVVLEGYRRRSGGYYRYISEATRRRLLETPRNR